MMYKQFLPDTPLEYKKSYDSHLADAGEEFLKMVEDRELLKSFNSSNGNPYRWTYGETSGMTLKNDFYVDNFEKYLGVKNISIKVDKLYPPSEQFDIINFSTSRVPGIEPSKEAIEYKQKLDKLDERKNFDDWITAWWHMDYGFSLNSYKLIVYLNDVEKDTGGILISNPTITPHLEDGRFRWYYDNDELKLNVESITTDNVPREEIIGPKGTAVCFNSHIAHTAKLPLHSCRKALHFVIEGNPMKPYEYYSGGDRRNITDG
jgi:hypothetical protein